VSAVVGEARTPLPTPAAVMARAGDENFPVASRALPRRVRKRLLTIYGFARLVDELGDADASGPPRDVGERPRDPGAMALDVHGAHERLAALDWLQDELERAFAGRARHPLLVRLQETIRESALPRTPFERLIEANRLDQRIARYETWEQLLGYCRLSANPVGELVLGVFGRATPERVALSDRICTALQLVEHWQDVAEDLGRGRIYLPSEDLERFGCSERELGEAPASWRVKGLIAFESARTRELLEQGAPLVGALHGRERLAVAAFVAGGRAALEAIERAGWDVLAGPPRATRWWRAAALMRTLAEQRG
jgi:squalene synthase HpnC